MYIYIYRDIYIYIYIYSDHPLDKSHRTSEKHTLENATESQKTIGQFRIRVLHRLASCVVVGFPPKRRETRNAAESPWENATVYGIFLNMTYTLEHANSIFLSIIEIIVTHPIP